MIRMASIFAVAAAYLLYCFLNQDKAILQDKLTAIPTILLHQNESALLYLEERISSQTPVIIRGSSVRSWAAISKWRNLSYFNSSFPSFKGHISSAPAIRFALIERCMCALFQNLNI